MTVWEMEVFSWSAYKTKNGDLLIKLDFHSEEGLGTLGPAPISIVAQSRRRSQVLSGKSVSGIRRVSAPQPRGTASTFAALAAARHSQLLRRAGRR